MNLRRLLLTLGPGRALHITAWLGLLFLAALTVLYLWHLAR